MNRFLILSLICILFLAERCKEDKPKPIQFIPIDKISFASPDSLLPPEKIDTSKLERVYRQWESVENDPGALTINKDRTFSLLFSGWIHQEMTGNWYLKNDTLNCYVINDYCDDSFIGNSNKYFTFQFILINHNLYAIGDSKSKPYFCKKIYDHFIECTHENWNLNF